MSLLNGFKKLLGEAGQVAQGVERQLNPFDGGATYNNPQPQQQQRMTTFAKPMPQIKGLDMSRIKQLQPMQPINPELQDQFRQPYPGAYADNTPIPSFMGKRYINQMNADPYSLTPETRVDPMVFGYPEDGSNQDAYNLQTQLKNQFYPKIRY